MSAARTTWSLVAVLAALLVADGAAWYRAGLASAPLPALAAFSVESADRILLDHGDARIALVRGADGWAVAEPFAHPADRAAVDALLGTLAGGVVPDARLGRGGHDAYGLDGADPVRARVLAGDAAIADLYVGDDAPGGATFVRFADDDQVYRARIGGRARFDRPARAWRDPTLWNVPARRVVGIGVVLADGSTVPLVRDAGVGSEAPGEWRLADDPAFPVDPSLAAAVASALADPPVLEVLAADHPVGLDRPLAIVTVTTDDGVARSARLQRAGDDGFAAIDGRDATYRLPGRLVERLVGGREAWRDRTLWAAAPLTEIEWVDGSRRLRVGRDARTGGWIALEPRGVDVDPRAVASVAAFLARPRAERFAEVSADQAGLPGTRAVVVVAEDGAVHTLQLGATAPGALDGRDGVWVRATDRLDRIGLIEADVAARIGGP